jgi:hypothetical protein
MNVYAFMRIYVNQNSFVWMFLINMNINMILFNIVSNYLIHFDSCENKGHEDALVEVVHEVVDGARPVSNPRQGVGNHIVSACYDSLP